MDTPSWTVTSKHSNSQRKLSGLPGIAATSSEKRSRRNVVALAMLVRIPGQMLSTSNLMISLRLKLWRTFASESSTKNWAVTTRQSNFIPKANSLQRPTSARSTLSTPSASMPWVVPVSSRNIKLRKSTEMWNLRPLQPGQQAAKSRLKEWVMAGMAWQETRP